MGNEERRLIDTNEIPWCHYDLEHYHPFVGVDKEYVDDMPTIDPESLRPKGRLEFKYIIDADYYSSVPAWFCTHCGWNIRDKGGKPKPPKMNYCPNCGAKMEG